MELTAKERIMLRQLLPEKGDFVTFRMVKELHEVLSFSSEEVESLEMVQDTAGRITWKPDKDVPREFSFDRKQQELIRGRLSQLDTDGEITEGTFSLYEKFVVD